MGEILVGITSWTEPTLIESGRFYLTLARSAEARLKFDVKAFRLFTHHQTPPIALPKDIREALPPELKEKKNIYYRDISHEIRKELWNRFARALLPLDSAGKLGVVLFQFPPWFVPGDKEREHIAYCQEMLPQYRLAIEVRYGSWTNEKNLERTLSFLRERNLAYVCCDEPQGFKSSVPFLAEVTCDIGIVRLHGRNRETWEKQGITTAQRFNYLYSQDELKELVPRVRDLASKTRQLHVLFNNCYGDKAVVNASQTRLMLD